MPETLECQDCNRKFCKRSNLEQHRRSIHEKVRYPCDMCGKQWTRRDARDRHVKSCLGRQPKARHLCSDCNMHFSSAFGLRRHASAVHDGKKFPCRYCGRDFSRVYRTDQHEKSCAAAIGHAGRDLSLASAGSDPSSLLDGNESVSLLDMPLSVLLGHDFDDATLDRMAEQLTTVEDMDAMVDFADSLG